MVSYDYNAGKSCEWHPDLIKLLGEKGADVKQKKGGAAKL